MSRYFIPFLALLLLSSKPTQPAEDPVLESLKAVETERLEALNLRDVDTIVRIEGRSVGLGWAAASPRENEPVAFRARIESWLGGMEHFEIELIDENYRVVGSTGLVIGTLVRRETPIEGSPITRRLRYSATYVLEGKDWYMVQYHRSPMPEPSP
jgi:hypothetical protein